MSFASPHFPATLDVVAREQSLDLAPAACVSWGAR